MADPKILLVEDNVDDVELTQAAARAARLHLDLVVMPDGESALDYLKSKDGMADGGPAVVILDLGLPGLGGLDVLRSIRLQPETKRLPVVILTGSERTSDVAACYDFGANSFVKKPNDHAAFLALMGQLGRYWIQTNIRPLG